MGSISNRVFGLANIAARAVQKEFPGKMVGLYAYHDQSVPPTFELEPNVYVELTAGFNRGEFTFDELKELWKKKTENLGYYLYLSVWGVAAQDAPQRQSGANVPLLKTYISDFASRGAASITAESSNNWGLNGRGYYIANKLMWNPQADADALLDDFYQHAFGAGAAPMKRYWERFDPGNDPIIGQHLLALGLRDVDEAARLAQGDAAVQARLDEIKQYLHYVRMYWNYTQLLPKDKAARKQATLENLNWAYRTRYAYMQHYMAMLQSWAREASKEFDEPDWHIAIRKDKPWETGEAPTQEETERLFQEDLAYFQLQPVEEKTFSSDMVPVVFAGDRPEFLKPAKSSELYQGGPRYLLYSVAGEPIEIDIFPGFIPAYRDRAPSRYILTDAAGKELANARLPLDNQKHSLKLAVPKAGLYYFDFTNVATGWRLEAEPGRVATIQLEAGRRIASLGNMKTMYFYVPKGTQSVDFYFKGYKHSMNGPDGEIIFAVPTSPGENFSVQVPPGQDGKLWNLTGVALGNFGFFNVPNVVAASPAALLVPREVAQKDGLQVRR